jgi:hypothetical protein
MACRWPGSREDTEDTARAAVCRTARKKRPNATMSRLASVAISASSVRSQDAEPSVVPWPCSCLLYGSDEHTLPTLDRSSYKEGVAGSNPASPTTEKAAFSR